MSRKNTETKTRILKSTWELLESIHGNSMRMSDVAKAAKLSRQAVYLHFPTRAELLIATTEYLDEVNNIEERLIASRTAPNGLARMNAFIEMWGNYIPEIYGVGKALLAMKDTDDAAAMAWNKRMQAVRFGCEAAIKALKADNQLVVGYSVQHATDILWTLLSVQNWAQYRQECGWSQKTYIETIQNMAQNMLTVSTIDTDV